VRTPTNSSRKLHLPPPFRATYCISSHLWSCHVNSLGVSQLAAGPRNQRPGRRSAQGTRSTPLPPLCRQALVCMGRHNEKTPTIFTKLAYGLLRKQPPAIVPLSKSLGPPAPQTSLGTPAFDRIPIHPVSFSQSSNSQTNSSFPFSLTSPQARSSSVTMHGSVFCIVWGPTNTIRNACGVYDD